MEFRRVRKTQGLQRPRVPLFLRAWIYYCLTPTFLTDFGSKYYQCVAQYLVRVLLRFEGVQSVFVVGGGLSRCKPAISDLDLVVLIRSENEMDFLYRVQKKLCTLQKWFPVIGEVHIASLDGWSRFEESSCASLEWFHSRYFWLAKGWVRKELNRKKTSSTEGRMALALFHLWKAHGFVIGSRRKYKGYYQAHFLREISKALDYLEGKQLTLRTDRFCEALMAKTVMALDEKAKEILSQKHSKAALVLRVEPDPEQKFVTELRQSYWLGKIEQEIQANWKIRASPVPDLLTFDKKTDAKEIEALLKDLYTRFSGDPSTPLLLHENTVKLIRCGFGWGSPMEVLHWLSDSDLNDSVFLNTLSNLSWIVIRDRLILNATLFRGKIATASSPQRLQRLFEELFFCYFTLSSRVLTNDRNYLWTEQRKHFPRVISRKKKDYLEALLEVERFLEVFQDQGELS